MRNACEQIQNHAVLEMIVHAQLALNLHRSVKKAFHLSKLLVGPFPHEIAREPAILALPDTQEPAVV